MKPLNRAQLLLCKAVFKLEYIPAYRRTYRVDRVGEVGYVVRDMKWKYYPSGSGMWGIHLLQRFGPGLFWRFLDMYGEPDGKPDE